MSGSGAPAAPEGEATRDGDPVHEPRVERLRERLRREALDGLLVVGRPNVRYLTGFTGSSGLLLVPRDGDPTLVTDFRYEEQAPAEVGPSVSVRVTREGLHAELAEAVSGPVSPRILGFDPAGVSVRDRRELGERCGGVMWEEAGGLVEAMRQRKEPAELSLLEAAVATAERALERALEAVADGITERQLTAELSYALRLAGSGPLPFEPIVASGPRSSLPHAGAGERRVREGDLLLFDFGAEVGGYCSDLTRTYAVGAARAWQREIHEAVREAQAAALAEVRADRPAREVDAAARRVLDERGLGDRFGHSTGHGIGLEVHEDPRLSRRSEDVLQEGHVVTVEPGVYLPGRGGVRIEDDVVVEEDRARVLGDLPRGLAEL